MKTIELTCIGCPLGCPLTVTTEDDNTFVSVTGNTCLNGKKYAMSEVTNPTRILTSSVKVSGGDAKMCSVKTAGPIPKDRVLACAKLLESVVVESPVDIGDVIVHNIDNTGVDVIATRSIKRN